MVLYKTGPVQKYPYAASLRGRPAIYGSDPHPPSQHQWSTVAHVADVPAKTAAGVIPSSPPPPYRNRTIRAPLPPSIPSPGQSAVALEGCRVVARRGGDPRRGLRCSTIIVPIRDTFGTDDKHFSMKDKNTIDDLRVSIIRVSSRRR